MSPLESGELSLREQQILSLLAAGHTEGAIAHRLGLSLRTVTYAITEITAKLKVVNRFELGLAIGARLAGGHPETAKRRLSDSQQSESDDSR